MQKPVETATLVGVMFGQLSAIKVQVDCLTRQQIGRQLFAVMAIVAGFIAAFAKDWVSRALSAFSQFYRARRLSREAKLDEKAETLAAHPELLIIEDPAGLRF